MDTDIGTAGTETLCEMCAVELSRVAEVEQLSDRDLDLLQRPKREVNVNIPVRMDDGEIRVFPSFRIQYNTARGPTKGAKGGVKVDPTELSTGELERVSRAYMKAYHEDIGPQTDIPAPDVNTDEQIMAWMRDEYEQITGTQAPGVITGKPPALSGSEGREYATSFGGAVVIDEFVSVTDRVSDDCTVAIQGFGNVGSYLAKFLAERGYTVVAVSNAQGGIYNESGIDVASLFDAFEDDDDIFGFGNKRITNEDLLTLGVDLLIPAAIEDQITGENVDEIQASAVVEMANGPTTPEADRQLAERGVPVVPDILANAGGVTGSYYEWVQNTTNEYWSESRVREKLDDHMRAAFTDLRNIKRRTDGTWREAAYTRAVDRVLEAEQYRSNLSR